MPLMSHRNDLFPVIQKYKSFDYKKWWIIIMTFEKNDYFCKLKIC